MICDTRKMFIFSTLYVHTLSNLQSIVYREARAYDMFGEIRLMLVKLQQPHLKTN